jgi:hypothetical protein
MTTDVDLRAWRAPDPTIPRNIDFPKGMLGPEERRALFWYARELVDGRGHVIDAGAFVGTSSFALACGLAHSRHPNAHRAKVHAYDMFEAFEDYTASWVSREFGGHIGTHFRDIYEYQLGLYLDRVVVHQGDILKQRWTGEPIEILFVDIAKSNDLNCMILREFFPALIPEHSLIMHQDFFLARHPYIHASMELINEHLELIEPLAKWCTRIWRLKTMPPGDVLDRLAQRPFAADETEELLLRAQSREGPGFRELYELLLATNDLSFGRLEAADRRLSAFKPAGDEDLVRMLIADAEHLKEWLARAV